MKVTKIMKKYAFSRSLHSNDCKFTGALFTNHRKGLSQEEYELAYEISAIKVSLKEHGWDRWQWHRYTVEDVKKHKYLTNFVEVFSDMYHGYIRADSKKSLKDACVRALNQCMKFNKCELKTNHHFKPKKGYENGLLSCVHCGFWGFTNRFSQIMRELDHYKMQYHFEVERSSMSRDAVSDIGLGFNLCSNLLIRDSLGEKKHTPIKKKKLTKKLLKDLRVLLKKHDLLQK